MPTTDLHKPEAQARGPAADALATASNDFDRSCPTAASLEEELFALIAAGLRRLKPHRAYLGPLVQAALSPLVDTTRSGDLTALRELQLRQVQALLDKHGFPERSPVTLQLYWTLYLGILAYWMSDRSPKQEDSRALADQSVSMFCDWLRRDGDRSPEECKP